MEQFENFNAGKFHHFSTEELPRTTLNAQYKRLRARDQALLVRCTDLIQLMINKGLSNERTKVVSEVRYIQSQVTNIKLNYRDFVSTTSSLQENEEEVVHPDTKTDQQKGQKRVLDTQQPGSEPIQRSPRLPRYNHPTLCGTQ